MVQQLQFKQLGNFPNGNKNEQSALGFPSPTAMICINQIRGYPSKVHDKYVSTWSASACRNTRSRYNYVRRIQASVAIWFVMTEEFEVVEDASENISTGSIWDRAATDRA